MCVIVHVCAHVCLYHEVIANAFYSENERKQKLTFSPTRVMKFSSFFSVLSGSRAGPLPGSLYRPRLNEFAYPSPPLRVGIWEHVYMQGCITGLRRWITMPLRSFSSRARFLPRVAISCAHVTSGLKAENEAPPISRTVYLKQLLLHLVEIRS